MPTLTRGGGLRDRWRGLVSSLCFFLLVLALYLGNGRTLRYADGGDTIPNRLIPFSLLRFGTLTLEPFRESFESSGGVRAYVKQPGGTLVSFYPIGTPLLAIPFYIPLFGYLAMCGHVDASALFAASELAEKLTASAMTALTVLVTWRLLRRETSGPRRLAIALGLAAGTGLWPVASQALWQHTAAALLLVVGARLLTGPVAAPQLYLAGAVFGLLAATRPPAVLFLVAAAVAVGWMAARVSHRLAWSHLARFALGSLPPLTLTVGYNSLHYGSWLGGYQRALWLFAEPKVLDGALGLLLSPNRGLLIFSPVCLVGLVGGACVLRRWRGQPVLAALLAAAIPYFLVHAAAKTWAAGWSFGPRFTTELMPLLALAAPAGLLAIGRLGRALMVPLAVWSLLIQISGAFFYPASNWNGRMSPDLERSAWSWQHFMPWEDFQVWRAGRSAVQGGDGSRARGQSQWVQCPAGMAPAGSTVRRVRRSEREPT